MIRAFIWLALLALLAGSAAERTEAHTRSTSHSSWTLDGPLIHMSFTVADAEVDHLSHHIGEVSDNTLISYLQKHVGVTAHGVPCHLTAPPKKLNAAVGLHRVEFQFACPSQDAIRLTSTAFIDLVPSHINFAQIQRPDGEFVEQVLDASQPTIDLDEAGGNTMGSASFLKFIEMGIMHIFTGIDHMSFLVGLVLISRRLRDLVFVVTGFTIGHSVTLALAVTGIIRPHAEFIDPLVALTIALIGVENIAIAAKRPTLIALWTGGVLAVMAGLRLAGIGLLPPLLLIGAAIFSANYLMVSGHLKDAGRLRLVVTLVFGLIHGFGFAADLLESRLPAEKLAEILVGFNLGVEIGQLSVVLLISGAAALLVRTKLALPRPIVVDVIASLLVTVGVYWFVSRSFAFA